MFNYTYKSKGHYELNHKDFMLQVTREIVANDCLICPQLKHRFQPNGRKSKLVWANIGCISQQPESPIDKFVESRRMVVRGK